MSLLTNISILTSTFPTSAFNLHFFSQYPSFSARSKLLGSSRYSFNSIFTSLASNSVTNQFSIGHSCPPFIPQRCPSIHVILLQPYTPSSQLHSASLNLLSQPRINITLASHGFQHAGPSLWNSLTHHLRYTDSYTVYKSNLKTLAIYIYMLLIRHNHVDFCILKLYYVILNIDQTDMT